MTDRFKAQLHPIDLLMVEDSTDDAELITDSLKEAGLTLTVRLVEDESAFLAALDERRPDAILSDWTLPDFSGRRAFAIAQECCPDVPFIFVSGTISESTAFEALRGGASDYVFKHQLQHLFPALTRAVNEAGALRSLRESENRLRTVLQTIPDLIWLKDSDGVYLTCNRMFERLYGAREADIVGKTDYDFVDRELADQFRDNDCQAMAAGKPRSNEEWIDFADDGRRVLLDTIKTPMFDAGGKLIGILGISRDITERKKAEEEKREIERQFQQAQKMEGLGVLAGGIAHDFNNILTVIICNCSLLQKRPQMAEALVPEIDIAAQRAADLCRQMLVYAGKAQPLPTKIYMTALLDEMVKMLKATISQNVVIKQLPSTVISAIKADASQIRQIVMNLIINASEAIGAAQGEVCVSLVQSDISEEQPSYDHLGNAITPGRFVCLEVKDNGCGMDEKTRLRIFEPFYTTKITGRGLGMSAVLGIIKAHNGALQLFSQPGQGTTFKVYLPLQSSDSVVDKSVPHVSPALWEGRGSILLVEDEPQIIMVAKMLLNALGFSVFEAANGEEALELYQKNSEYITLVVTDIGMPIMNGYELFRELKKLNPELPIIISSGFGDEVTTSQIPREDIAGMLSKPYNFDQLREVLKGVVEGVRKRA